ncbi:YihY/virulence factor BrkB family protein [Pararhizobium mangrovi]|uniref:YihY/virulence factor BrkB family protein n=1 Tax=Pararhizobium mangrovi TaxID=2590452 RepID=A0A506TYZ3_9HYPH|nr:YihY/virulence factor BrkB family protein [Pararhizobium mangrovi]TPW25945.1 YihY/virulence factor BrkB family protein [Pararhizobium mangrovi]
MHNVLRLSWRIVANAVGHFNADDGWAMASHVALSIILALFPFILFGTALASFLGASDFADTTRHLIFDTWPSVIAKPIATEATRVMTEQHKGLLTISVLAAAFFASNGVEALRVSLNRAYRVSDRRSIVWTRAQSLLFVILAVLVFLAISVLIVLSPLLAGLLKEGLPVLAPAISLVDNWRVVAAGFVLLLGLVTVHIWLPAGHRRFVDVLPGVVLTLTCWLAGASVFSAYLQSFQSYVYTYAGLASIMIALVFLYMISVIFILGAELNASILALKQ